jgi:hypothetical protein
MDNLGRQYKNCLKINRLNIVKPVWTAIADIRRNTWKTKFGARRARHLLPQAHLAFDHFPCLRLKARARQRTWKAKRGIRDTGGSAHISVRRVAGSMNDTLRDRELDQQRSRPHAHTPTPCLRDVQSDRPVISTPQYLQHHTLPQPKKLTQSDAE